MTSFDPVEHRLTVTCRRYPAFPYEGGVLIRLIRYLQKLFQDDANTSLRAYGINYAEYNLLMMMHGTESGTLSPSELADAAGEKSANITRLTTLLSDKKLIARASNLDDRRKIELTLTPAGHKLIEDFLPSMCELVERHANQLNGPEQQQLIGLLKKMLGDTAAQSD